MAHIKPTPHSIRSILRWAGAPERVLAWADAEPMAGAELRAVAEDVRPLLDRTPSASVLLWVVAVVGVPLDELATAVALLIESRVETLGEPRLVETLELGLETIPDPRRGQALLLKAKVSELLAEEARGRADGGYRDQEGPFSRTCRAVGHFARACEAIGAHGARMEAERMEAARRTAGILNIGVNAMVGHQHVARPTLSRPIALDVEPIHEMVFATDRLSKALAQLELHEKAEALRDELLESLED